MSIDGIDLMVADVSFPINASGVESVSKRGSRGFR